MLRFDLEQQIMSCWQITNDLATLNQAVLEQDLSKDDISNILLGIEKLYNLKFDQTFRTFEALLMEHYQETLKNKQKGCHEPRVPDCVLENL